MNSSPCEASMNPIDVIDVGLVKRAEAKRSLRIVKPHCDPACLLCRGAAIWRALDGLRGLNLTGEDK